MMTTLYQLGFALDSDLHVLFISCSFIKQPRKTELLLSCLLYKVAHYEKKSVQKQCVDLTCMEKSSLGHYRIPNKEDFVSETDSSIQLLSKSIKFTSDISLMLKNSRQGQIPIDKFSSSAYIYFIPWLNKKVLLGSLIILLTMDLALETHQH